MRSEYEATTEPPGMLRREARPYVLGSAILLLSGAYLAVIDRPWSPFLTVVPFGAVAGIVSILYWAFLLIRHPRGIPDSGTRISEALAFVLLLAVLQGSFHSVKQTIGHSHFTSDAALAMFDARIHGPLLWRRTIGLLGDVQLALLDRIYLAWGMEATIFAVWLSWTRCAQRHR
ncbi:MAG TPA: hypothetical protein VMS54_09810, partial [Vicinamibacterales bacterium]|nr:hypothetical protein [Vicinamibacterales bacterium]